MLNCYFFFFSSRRRHTRYWRDWSSDVCSSDLRVVAPKQNEQDFDEFPPSLKDHMEFIWVEQIDEVLREALEVDRPKRSSRRPSRARSERVPAAARRV